MINIKKSKVCKDAFCVYMLDKLLHLIIGLVYRHVAFDVIKGQILLDFPCGFCDDATEFDLVMNFAAAFGDLDTLAFADKGR